MKMGKMHWLIFSELTTFDCQWQSVFGPYKIYWLFVQSQRFGTSHRRPRPCSWDATTHAYGDLRVLPCTSLPSSSGRTCNPKPRSRGKYYFQFSAGAKHYRSAIFSSPVLTFNAVKVTLDISGSPTEIQWALGNIPGELTALCLTTHNSHVVQVVVDVRPPVRVRTQSQLGFRTLTIHPHQEHGAFARTEARLVYKPTFITQTSTYNLLEIYCCFTSHNPATLGRNPPDVVMGDYLLNPLTCRQIAWDISGDLATMSSYVAYRNSRMCLLLHSGGHRAPDHQQTQCG